MPKAMEDHSFDRRKSDVNWNGLHQRVQILEEWKETFSHDFNELKAEVRSNTKLTEEIHGNTTDIVEAVKWLSTTKKLVLVIFASVTGISGAIVAAVHALRALSGS